ncbi:MAG TPA: hypothetical protein PLU93_06545 [Treponemataceae bacterium]|jgi:hypothetical protein|nr:hypothetical protein [Treponemataceae bacterium]
MAKKRSGRPGGKSARPRRRRNKPIISTRVALTAAAALAALAVAIGILSIVLTREPKRGVILVPEGGSYEASWAPALAETASRLGLDALSIRTYSSDAELAERLARARRERIVFAEAQVGPGLAELSLSGLARPVDRAGAEAIPFYRGFLASLEHPTDGGSLMAIPLAFEPWITVARLNRRNAQTRFPAILAVAAKSDEDALACAALASSPEGQAPDAVATRLANLAGRDAFQRNAFTYSPRDAFAVFSDGGARYAYLPYSFFRALSPEEIIPLEIVPTPEQIATPKGASVIAKGTAIVVPAKGRFRSLTTARVAAAISAPDLIYAVARARNALPATTDTKVRDFHSDRIRELARGAARFSFIGAMPASLADGTSLVEAARRALVAR